MFFDFLFPKKRGKKITVPATINPSKVACRTVTRKEVKQAVQEFLDDGGFTFGDHAVSSAFDANYIAYRKADIVSMYESFPSMYGHKDALTAIGFPRPEDGADCDNIAEHNSYWFHRLMPSSAVISISGWHSTGGHRWCGVVTTMLDIVWFGGTPSRYDTIKHIDY